VVPVVTEMFFGFVSLFDRTVQASAKRNSLLGFRSHAKDNPAISIRLLWSLVLCNVFLKVQIAVFVFNDSCAACKKKVDQLPVNLKN
jgi:hypothetical protein